MRRAAGMSRSGLVPYYRLTDFEREAVLDWCRLHNVDASLVPVDAVPELDAAVDEWCIEMYVRAEGGGIRVMMDGEPMRRVVRRRWKADLPWPAQQSQPLFVRQWLNQEAVGTLADRCRPSVGLNPNVDGDPRDIRE